MEKLMTPEFRVSFPNVFEPHAFEGQQPKYSLVMLFPKGTDLTSLKKLATNAVVEKWGSDPAKYPKNLRNPLRDGDDPNEGKTEVDGYSGCMFATASSKMKPGVVDQNVQPIISEDDFYAGCYARATITAYAYNKAGNAGVAFGLQNIQKLRDGDAFSGRSRADEDFEAIAGFESNSASPEVVAADDMFA